MRWGLVLLLARIAAWLSIRQIRWTTLQAVLAESSLLLLGVALGTVLVTTVAKAARWYILLRHCNAQVSVVQALGVLLMGRMGNSFLPALTPISAARTRCSCRWPWIWCPGRKCHPLWDQLVSPNDPFGCSIKKTG